MGKLETDSENLHLLSVLLASEMLPATTIPLGYAVGETSDNQNYGLELLVKLLTQEKIDSLGIADPGSSKYDYGYPGPNYCLKELGRLKVSKEKICLVKPEQPMENITTISEMEIVIKWMKKRNLSELLIVSPTFHLLRAYLSTLTALVKLNAENIKTYALGVPVPVYHSVYHSQGKQFGPRAEITLDEIRKCKSYPNLISVNQALIIHKAHRM